MQISGIHKHPWPPFILFYIHFFSFVLPLRLSFAILAEREKTGVCELRAIFGVRGSTRVVNASCRILIPFLFAIIGSPNLAADTTSDREEFNTAYFRYQELAAEARFAEAVPFAQRAYELGATLYGPEDRNTAALALNLGRSLGRSNQTEEAVSVLKNALALYEKSHGKDAIALVDPLVELGTAILQTANSASHRKYYTRALGIIERAEGADSLLYGDIAMEVGTQMVFRAHARNGRRYLESAYNIFKGHLGPGDVRTGLAAFQLGKYHLVTGDLTRAEQYLLEALNAFGGSGDPDNHLKLTAHAFLVELYDRQGKTESATEHSLAIGRLVPFTSAEDYVPLIRPEPEYPKQALRNREQGFVVVEFTVDEMGMARDAKVVESEGHKEFDEAALAAVSRFRYAPRFVENHPVATEDVRHRFDFSPAKYPDDRACEIARHAITAFNAGYGRTLGLPSRGIPSEFPSVALPCK